MEIDGGGWTVCMSRTISGGTKDHVGRKQLASTYGDPGSNDFGANCAKIMYEHGKHVEFMLFERAGQKKWQWVFPIDTKRIQDRWIGGYNTDGDKDIVAVSQCKGSAMSKPKSSSSWKSGWHNSGGHRTSDHYFIWQVGRSGNNRLIMELGNGDGNHPFGFMTNCDDSSWWGSCRDRGKHSVAYKTDAKCKNYRKGPVGVAFRTRG